jgi:hypothetical protein
MLIGAVALGFRIGWQDYWWDEHVTLMFSRMGWHELVVGSWGLDTHRPVYYALQKAWNDVFGGSVTAVRSLPATLHLLMIPLFYLAARQMRGNAVALIAVLILATSPIFVAQGREIRMYALMNLCLSAALLCALCLAGRFRAGKIEMSGGVALLWTGMVLGLAAGFYAHSIAIFVTVLFALWILGAIALRLYPLAILWQAIPFGLLYCLLILPALLPFFSHFGSTLGEGFWVPEPSFDYVYGQFAAAYPYSKWAKPVVLVLFLIGLWRLRKTPDLALLLALIVIGLPTIVLAVSYLKPIFMTRVIGWSSLVATLPIALAVAELPRLPRIVAAIGVATAQLAALMAFYPPAPEHPPLVDFRAQFEQFDPARDVLVIGAQKTEPALRWYYPALFEGETYAISPGDRPVNVIGPALRARFVPMARIGDVASGDHRVFVLWDRNVAEDAPALLQAVAALAEGRQSEAVIRNSQYQLDVWAPHADAP